MGSGSTLLANSPPLEARRDDDRAWHGSHSEEIDDDADRPTFRYSETLRARLDQVHVLHWCVQPDIRVLAWIRCLVRVLFLGCAHEHNAFAQAQRPTKGRLLAQNSSGADCARTDGRTCLQKHARWSSRSHLLRSTSPRTVRLAQIAQTELDQRHTQRAQEVRGQIYHRRGRRDVPMDQNRKRRRGWRVQVVMIRTRRTTALQSEAGLGTGCSR